MNVLVIGAGGKTGALVVERALAAGHGVIALLHSSGTEEKHPLPPEVRVVHGDVHDPTAVRDAMAGCDAVVETLGGKTPFLKTDLESSAARVVLAAMHEIGAKRIVAISVLGAGDSAAQSPYWYEHIFLPTFMHGALPDKNAMEALVKSSGVEWVLVRPPFLSDDEATGSVKVITGNEQAHKITRGDLAQFLVDQLTSDTYVGQAVVIANS
jgi:uncharacterized protein YbjT (DUF2867 family)